MLSKIELKMVIKNSLPYWPIAASTMPMLLFLHYSHYLNDIFDELPKNVYLNILKRKLLLLVWYFFYFRKKNLLGTSY